MRRSIQSSTRRNRFIPASGIAKSCISLLLVFLLNGCEDFLTPELNNIARTDEIFEEWDEYRSAGLGLYALQQNLVDQIFILGEVRGDMLKLTQNSTADLEEVGNYAFNPNNEFMNPKGFYRLIAASNALAVKIKEKKSDLLDRLDTIPYQDMSVLEQSYKGLYAEVLCMRAWAYFNMVRIFGEIPCFPEELSTEEELNAYVLSDPASALMDIHGIVEIFSVQLEDEIGDGHVGANYDSEGINDPTWNYTSWNNWAYYSLMGQMYLHVQDYAGAIVYFEKIIYDPLKDYYFLNLKQHEFVGNGSDHLTYMPYNTRYWSDMFRGLDGNEHMLAVWFNKERKQQNRLQYYLSNQGVNMYALAPSPNSVINWETQWHDATFVRDANNPENMYMLELGVPGDFIRGHGASYAYMKGGIIMSDEEHFYMMELKRNGLFNEVENLMKGVDTVVYKYSIGRDPYDLDAHYSIFRAGQIHLYYAEALNAVGRYRDAEDILNRGISFGTSRVSGVRGRAYLAYKNKFNTLPPSNVDEGIEILDVMPVHDPFNNEITGFRDYAGQQEAKEFLRDSLIIRERALECAWEGERFYDLIRIAEKWPDKSFLADKVAAKYPAGQREEIKALLSDKEKWYLPYFNDLRD